MANEPDGDPLRLPELTEQELAARVEELMKLVPPELTHRFQPIDPAKNAWPVWRKANEAAVEEPDDEPFDEAYIAFVDDQVRPSNEMLARIRKWSDDNQAAMKLFDEGLALGALETPKAGESVRRPLEVLHLSDVRALARQKELASSLATLDGQIDAALEHASAILEAGMIVLESECLFVDFLVGVSLVGISVSSAYAAAVDVHASEAQAKAAVATLGTIELGAAYRRALRVELCRSFVPDIAEIPEGDDARDLARFLILMDWPRGTEFTEEGQANRLGEISQIEQVISGHPAPFDRAATVREASMLLGSYFTELDELAVGRADYLKSLNDELKPWPSTLAADPFLPFFGEDDDDEPITPESLAAAREALRKVNNFVGKRLIKEAQQHHQVFVPEEYAARILARRLQIALAHHERRHGALPESLQALVADGWFPSVPLDPYDRQPFRYSAVDRLIWSVDRDGENDGPAKLKDGSFVPGEWSIAPIWTIPPVPEL